MKLHHYMKYLFVLLLFLPTCLMAQNKEEKMPGHITKIQKLEDVNVTGNRPHFIRLKGYYRSYQTNDSVMKYFNDGIVEVLHQPEEWKDGSQCLFQKKSSQ